MADVNLSAIALGFKGVQRELDKTADGLTKLGKAAGGITGTLSKVGAGLRSVGTTLSIAVTAPLVAAAAASIKFASDLTESLNKVDVTFGKSARKVKEFAQTSAKSFAIAEAAALSHASILGDILQVSGLTEEATSEMSVTLLKLAADLASFKDIKIEDALTKIRAGLVGMSRPLRDVGIFISEAAVRSKAFELGLARGTGELTDQIKIQARYAIIMDQSKKTQEDFTRTIDEFANQTRILSAVLIDLAADLGQILLPVAKDVVGAILEVIDVFSEMSPEAKRMTLALAGIAAVLGPLFIGLGLVFAIIGSSIAGVTAMATAFTALAVPIGLVALKIGLIIAAVGTVAAAFFGLTRLLVRTAEKFEAFGEIASATFDTLKSTAKIAWAIFKGDAKEAARLAQNEVLRSAQNQAKAWKNLKAEMGDVWENVKQDGIDAMKLLGDVASDAGSAIGVALSEGASFAKDKIKELAESEAFAALKATAGDVAADVLAKMKDMVNGIADRFFGIKEAAKDAGQGIEDGFKEPIEEVKSAWALMLERMSEGLEEWAKRSVVTLETWGELALETFETFKKGVGDAVATAIVEGENLGVALQGVLKNVMKAVISSLIQVGIQALVTAAISALTNTQQATSSGARIGAETFGNAFSATSAIPIVGPALAPAVASAALAAVTAGMVGAAATGAAAAGGATGAAAGGLENVPETGTFVLHRNERVFSPGQNRQLMGDLNEALLGGGAQPIIVQTNLAGNIVFDEHSENEFNRRIERAARDGLRRRRRRG